ncbi:hypothetical protein GCM10022247_46480 [Allokutzneria multivorans]|uniref:PH domain-containing protein n=1 Tax=Allokutzneria multivorans TaxID=1142134 RepID=A0ABP7SX46_9PSEU
MQKPTTNRRHMTLAMGVPLAAFALLVLVQWLFTDVPLDAAEVGTLGFKLGLAAAFGAFEVWAFRGTSTNSRWAPSYSAIGTGVVGSGYALYLAGDPLPFWAELAVGLVVAIALTALVVLIGREVEFADADESARIDLEPGEVATWSRTSPLKWPALAFILVPGILFAYLVFSSRAWSVLPALILPSLALAFLVSFRIRVDINGLSVWPTLLRWPRKRIRLEQIESATVRRAGDTFAMYLRNGETLVVKQKNGTEYTISVNDAHTAAALLNTLAARTEAR